LSRIIKTESVGKDRNRLCKEIVLTIRQLVSQTQPDNASRDMAAFISNSLLEINRSIDVSVTAWEKRGYWVKADRFRMEWTWTSQLGSALREALLNDDWGSIAILAVRIAQKLSKVKIATHHRLGTPWVGARLKRASS
jgi:hypothetical protein